MSYRSDPGAPGSRVRYTSRAMLRPLACLGVALLLWAPGVALAKGPPKVAIQIAGEPTQDSILLHARLSGPGRARFRWVADESGKVHVGAWRRAEPDSDNVVKAVLTGLAPASRYRWRTEVEGEKHEGEWSVFRTLYPPTRADAVSFAVVSSIDQHSFLRGKRFGIIETTPPAVQPDRKLGYRALQAIAEQKPLFVVFDGDVVDYEGPEPGVDATSMRAIWHEQFALPRFAELFARTSTYWLKNDRDFRFEHADRTGDRPPSAALGRRIFREQVPVVDPDEPDAQGWRTHRVNADLQIWLLESRDHRAPNASPDGPHKSMWGKNQRSWLKRTLLASKAAWRVVLTPTPLVGPDRNDQADNHTSDAGFHSEGEAFLAWAADHGLPEHGLVIIAGGRHWQYHSIHPTGVHELSPGPLHDQNLSRGIRPGGYRSTDPDGRIVQPFLEDNTGGFLRIDVVRNDLGSTLRALWTDEHGTPRNRWRPPPRP